MNRVISLKWPNWRSRLAQIVAVLLCVMAPARAGDVLDDHALNTTSWSWGIWGKTTITDVKDSSLRVGGFKRVILSPAPEHLGDAGVYVTLQKPAKKGDVIVFVLYARAEQLPQDNEFTPLTARVFDNTTKTISVVPEAMWMVGKSWRRLIASGIADKDYPPGSLAAGILLGTDEQTLDIAEVVVAAFPSGFDVSSLPHD